MNFLLVLRKFRSNDGAKASETLPMSEVLPLLVRHRIVDEECWKCLTLLSGDPWDIVLQQIF